MGLIYSEALARLSKQTRVQYESATKKEKKIIVALANRSYHLPAYDYCADFRQYFANNHPFFGIFCKHPLHPIGVGMRIVALVGSILFGLTISNLFFLLVLQDEQYQQALFTISLGDGEYSLTSGMLLLWTVGGGVHATYDICIWYIAACACCPWNKTCKSYGTYIVIFLVLVLAFAASLVVVVRVSEIDAMTLDSAGLLDDEVGLTDEITHIHKEDVQFLLGYAVEFSLALLVYYPLCSFLFFSGVLGCGFIPGLGGRPREIQLLKKEIERRSTDLDDGNSTEGSC
jgi:hypothetical protein